MKSKEIKNKYLYAIIFTIAIFAYANTINHSYTWDDALVITNNKYTKKGFSGLKDIWSKKVFLHNRSVYRPVPQSVYAITYQFFDYNPKPAHIINIIIYALLSVATFWFLTLLFSKQNKWLLFFISLLFVLHPLHTEVVANIKSLDEMLAYFFSILSLIFWIKSFKQFSKNIVFVFIFIILALLSKISSITILPFFIIIYFYKLEKTNLFIANLKSKLQNTKTLFLSKNYSSKFIYYSFILVFFLSIIAVVYNNTVLSFLILALLLLLLYKTNNNRLIFVNSIITIVLLTLFSYHLLLILYSIFSVIYFTTKAKKYFNFYSIFVLVLFSLSFLFLTQEYLIISFLIVLFSFSYLYSTNKKKLSIIPLLTILILSVVVSSKIITSITISMILLIVFALLNNKKREKYIYLFLIIISVFYTIALENKPSISNEIYNSLKPSFSNIKPKDNIEPTLEMSPLNNTLFNENNSEIKYATIATIQLKYLQLLVFPHPLVHQYGFNQIEKTNFKSWKVWFSIIIHLLLFLFALYKLKSKSPISFGILFYLSTISIYTNIVVLMPDTLAERFLFTPSLGFAIAFVFALDFLLKKLNFKRRTFVLLFLLLPIYIAFAYKTYDRNKAWKNNFILAEKTIKHAKNNAAINAQYASELYMAGKDSSLIFYHYNKAIEIFPNFYSANKDLSKFFIERQNTKQAEKYLLKSIYLKPRVWENYYFLAFIQYENKYYEKAVPYFENCLSLGEKIMQKEKLILASEFLARCYFNTHQMQKADALLKSLFAKHKTKSSIILLGNIYNQFGNIQKSIETYEFLLEFYPEDKQLKHTINILKNKLQND